MKQVKTLSFFILSFAIASFILFSCKPKPAGQAEGEGEEMIEEVTPNQLTQAETDEGWNLLFDGKTTEGWRNYGKETFPDSGWVIEDDALKCAGSGMGEAGGAGGDIIYDKKFKDFHLKLEWKISEGGNSGIFYLAQEIEGEQIWKSAPEMQILDNERHPDAMLGVDGNRQAGSLYDLIPAVPQNADSAGTWNAAEIMVYQGTVVHFMNGEKVLEYHLGTPDWDEMIENSKFKDFEPFGKATEGYIGLQDHGNDVWFRNIKIKEL